LFETLCGIVTASSVAPAIAIVDQSIFSNASGREPMWQCIKRECSLMLRKPSVFVRQPALWWIMGVYSATYIVANVSDSLYRRYELSKELAQRSAQRLSLFTFATTSATNVSASIYKDRAFAVLFASTSQTLSRAVPATSLALFGVRDAITVGASFTLVPHVARQFERSFSLSPQTSITTAQLLTPCVAQFVNTPLYLLGLSLYNSPNHTTPQRIQFMQQNYLKTVAARWARIGPAFSIGGVVNRSLRSFVHEKIL